MDAGASCLCVFSPQCIWENTAAPGLGSVRFLNIEHGVFCEWSGERTQNTITRYHSRTPEPEEKSYKDTFVPFCLLNLSLRFERCDFFILSFRKVILFIYFAKGFTMKEKKKSLGYGGFMTQQRSVEICVSPRGVLAL